MGISFTRRVIDVILNKYNRLTGIFLGQLLDCRTGRSTNTSGGAHERLEDDEALGRVSRLGRHGRGGGADDSQGGE